MSRRARKAVRKASADCGCFAGLVLAAGSGGLQEPPTIFWRAKVIGRISLCAAIIQRSENTHLFSSARRHLEHLQFKAFKPSPVIAAVDLVGMQNSRQKNRF